MAEPASKTEQSESMEEILQSIKKIMDDNSIAEPQKPATSAAAAEADIYDLTNVIKDEGTMAESPVAPKAAPSIPEAIAKQVTPPPAAAKASAEPAAAPAAVLPAKEAPAVSEEEGLLSKNAKSAAASAFKKIGETTSKREHGVPVIPSPQFRSGMTLEDLVLEALRPMLKAWLDENLPIIAQKIVEKEVKRIVTFHYDSE